MPESARRVPMPWTPAGVLMSDPVLIAAITLVGSGIGALYIRLMRRITVLEKSERRLWWWARNIADYYYRYRRDGAPDLPPPPTDEKDPTA